MKSPPEQYTTKFSLPEWVIQKLLGKREIFRVEVATNQLHSIKNAVIQVNRWCRENQIPKPQFSTIKGADTRSWFYILRYHCYSEEEAVSLKMFLDSIEE